MSRAVKLTLQIGFLAVFIYVLAAIFGALPGASVRGPGFAARVGKRKKGRMSRGVVLSPVNGSVASGMYGELVASPGSDTTMVGAPPF